MTRREFKRRKLFLGVLLLGMVAALAAFVLIARRSRTPGLDGLQPLLADRRFDEVERRLRDYLRVHPESVQANMLMAQVALGRDEQQPRLALDHLARIKARDRGTQAIVMLNQGKAYSALGRNERAEAAWKSALRLEPRVPEAGWDLLSLYYVEGRREEAHRLGMALHLTEPDPRDRVQLLLELVRHDAEPLGPDSIMRTLEPLVRGHPEDLHMAIAFGLAMIRNSRTDQGVATLRGLVGRFPDNSDAWDALLLGLDEAGKTAEMAEALAQLPAALAGDIRFERRRAAVAEAQRDWSKAADLYLRAWRVDPSDLRVLYRLTAMLKAAGRLADAESFEPKIRAAQAAKNEILPLYREANAVKTLGVAPHPDLYHRLADLRERMGRYDEALEWHRLVLRDQRDDPISRSAVERLKATIDAGMASRP